MISLGTTWNAEIILSEEMLARHCLLCGPTGTGKSKLMESMALQIAAHGHGLTLIDKDGKTARDFFARISECLDKISPFRRRQVYFLQPSEEQMFAYDPFETKYTGRKYRLWLPQRVETVGRILGRKQGVVDYKEQVRRERYMSDVLFLVGTKVNGKHLGVNRALDVLDIGGGAWRRMFDKIAPYLPREILVDWLELQRMSPRDRKFYTDSTWNWFRAFLCHDLVKEMLDNKKQSIDFAEVIRSDGIIIADLEETPFFPEEPGDAVAALLSNEIADACYFEKRRHYLFLEEADKVFGEHIGDWLARARKRKLSLVISIQDLSALKNERTDLRGKALSQPGIHIAFRQKGREELEEFSHLFATGVLDFSVKLRPMDRPDGHDWHVVKERGTSITRNRAITNGASEMDTETEGETFGTSMVCTASQNRSRSRAISNTFMDTITWQDSDTEQEAFNLSKNKQKSQGASNARSWDEHQNLLGIPTAGIGGSHSDTESKAEGKQFGLSVMRGRTAADGGSRGNGGGVSNGTQEGEGRAVAIGNSQQVHGSSSKARGKNNSVTNGHAESESTHFRHIPLQRYREELYAEGLKTILEAQYARFKKILRRLGTGEFMIVGDDGIPAVGRAHFVPDPKFVCVENFKRMVWSWHPCFFVPTGESGTNGYTPSSGNSSRRSNNSSKQASSPATKLLAAAPKNSGNGKKSNTSGPSNGKKRGGRKTATECGESKRTP